MEKFEELTEQSILSLTDEQIELIIKLKKAENGIKFVIKPERPNLFNVKEPEMVAYTCNLFGDYLAFADINELNELIAFIGKCKTKASLGNNYDLPANNRYFVDNKIKTHGYSSDSWDKITSQKVYSFEYYNEILSQLKENKKISEGYEKQLKEYEAYVSDSKWIEDEVYEKILGVRGKYDKLNNYCRKFKFDYLPLSGSDEGIAMNFMDKAYSLTEEEKGYILLNYKDVE